MHKTITIKETVLGGGMPKICVPLSGTGSQLYAQAERAISAGAQVLEWRADTFDDLQGDAVRQAGEKLARIAGRVPILFTLRTLQEGGSRSISGQEYLQRNLQAIGLGLFDLLDVEFSCLQAHRSQLLSAARKAGIKTVVSSHDFEKTVPGAELYAKLCALQNTGGDIPKLAVMPQSALDVLALVQSALQFQQEAAKGPFIALSMGDLGKVSRVAGQLFGSALTFGTAGEQTAPGQIDAQLLKQCLQALCL